MLKFEILLEESTAEEKNAGEDSDAEEEESKKKAEAKKAQAGPDDLKKQTPEVVQELPPNPELARRNQELEHRLRDMTVDSENLRIQLAAMARQVQDLQGQADKTHIEKEQAIRSHEGKLGAQSQWEEKCKSLEAEVARLKDELAKAKAGSIYKKNYAMDDI